ncbi:MAG: bifunctional 3-demethylubiquinone-9 3-methyltransferase/ 2-octaprenyl-6-hydroxy phenol methylase [Methanosaeta sp. PtaU1.Bin060]|nr:MAG: bifunctional 3-demethylubiquinone-9 3-methyltransferase/ 2-octaprenyl-6-hydroxy phenol methylase [Methanosaeta sp. PtaU1.Bin060]
MGLTDLGKCGTCDNSYILLREMKDMFTQLEEINSRPEPFAFYTAADLWTDEHTSEQMLAYHLNSDIDVSSRRGEFIDRSVDWIASRFSIGTDTQIADFGCGPGLYANRLAKVGASVTGIDFSKRSIGHAREVAAEAGLNIEYVNQNYLDFETENRFDLILMIMCDFCALGPSQRRIMLAKFHSLLLPGGSVLLDVYSLNAFKQRDEASSYGVNLLDGFWSREKYHGFLNIFKYDDAKVVLDKYTIVESARTRTIYNWLQYFTPESLWREFEEAGFTQQELYADVAGTPFDETASEFAVVAQKK